MLSLTLFIEFELWLIPNKAKYFIINIKFPLVYYKVSLDFWKRKQAWGTMGESNSLLSCNDPLELQANHYTKGKSLINSLLSRVKSLAQD